MLIFRFGVHRVCGNRVGGNCLKLNFRNFVPITFDLKKILANRVFTYCFIIPYQYPVGENIYPSDGVKYSKAPLSGSLWAISSNGSKWVHTDGITTTSPNSSPSHIMTTLYTSKGEIPVILYLYRNWVTGGSAGMLSKFDPLLQMEYEPLIALISGKKGSVMSGRKIAFILTRLV